MTSLRGGTTKQSMRVLVIWIASYLIMTKLVTPSLRGTMQSKLSSILLDCFAPLAMTATCIVITLFCRGFFPCPLLAMTIRQNRINMTLPHIEGLGKCAGRRCICGFDSCISKMNIITISHKNRISPYGKRFPSEWR